MSRKTVFLTTAVFAGLSMIAPASAQQFTHYLEAGIGLNFIVSDGVSATDGVDSVSASYDADEGLGVTGAYGLAFASGFRTELEVGYRTNDIDEVSAEGLTAEVIGEVNATTIMFNGYYDFDDGASDYVPYIGGGLGFLRAEVGELDETVFAYQIKAGVGRYFGAGDSSQIGAEISYLGAEDLDATVNGIDYSAEYGGADLQVYYRQLLR